MTILYAWNSEAAKRVTAENEGRDYGAPPGSDAEARMRLSLVAGYLDGRCQQLEAEVLRARVQLELVQAYFAKKGITWTGIDEILGGK